MSRVGSCKSIINYPCNLLVPPRLPRKHRIIAQQRTSQIRREGSEVYLFALQTRSSEKVKQGKGVPSTRATKRLGKVTWRASAYKILPCLAWSAQPDSSVYYGIYVTAVMRRPRGVIQYGRLQTMG